MNPKQVITSFLKWLRDEERISLGRRDLDADVDNVFDDVYESDEKLADMFLNQSHLESDMNKHNNLIDVLNGHLTKASGAKKVNEEKHVKTEYCAVLAGKDKPKRFKSKKDLESWILDEFIETGKNPLDQHITHQAYVENFFEDGDSAGVDNFTVEWSLKIS